MRYGSIQVEMTFDAAHRLMGYEGQCRNIHGHTYKIRVTLSTDAGLDDLDMLLDFRSAKATVKSVVDEYDHALLLRTGDPLWSVLGRRELIDEMGFKLKLRSFSFNPTAEVMAARIKRELIQAFDDAATVTEVRLWETPSSSVTV